MPSILEGVFSSSEDELNKMLLSLVGMPKSEIKAELSIIKSRVEEVAQTIPTKGNKGDKGDKGDQGIQGPKGEPGKDGRDGYQGKDGKQGVDGINGVDGKNGVSVIDANVEFDNSIVFTLDNGNIIDAGQINLPKEAISGIIQSYVKEGGAGGGGTVRVVNVTSSSSITIDSSITDQYSVTALAVGTTFNAPTGSPTAGQKLIIRIKDNGTGQTLAWNAIFRVIGVTLPTTTVANKTFYIACIYNLTDTSWDVVSVAQQV